jgi:hypothetical protein
MRQFLSSLALLLFALPAFAQVHITQPFAYSFDEQTQNVNGTAGQQQINHFELQVDTGTFTNIGLPNPTASTVPAATSFSVNADPTLSVATHTFTVRACPTTASTGCFTSASFAFALDAVPAPAPNNLRVGPKVGP